jgi:multisubunit Na+/H+ antiporter MnhF subunit
VSVIFSVRARARGNVSAALVLWAIAMTVVLFMEIVSPSALLTVSGFAITAILGGLLGWRRRMGTLFVAPFVSWLFAWFPMEIASMIHFGVLKGFLLGLLIVTFGWIGIGFVEWAWLTIVAVVVRALHGSSSQDRVVIIDPED